MLRLEMLPAEYGDCLWLEYGEPDAPRRVLIDAGLASCYADYLKPKLMELTDEDRKGFELMVCTHIDADHISGTLKLLAEADDTGFDAKQVWFNGYRHLPDEAPDTLGPVQGEELTDMLVKPRWNWNEAFGGEAVMVPDAGDLPRIELEGGLSLTLLSPDATKLSELKPVWEKECQKAGLEPGFAATGEEADDVPDEEIMLLGGGPPDVEELADEPFKLDSSKANGSSIAFMAEYEGRKLLLCGDAHPDLLVKTLPRWSGGDRPAFDVFKLPHHGSKANVNADVVRAVDCATYAFSTNGKRFKHPNKQAAARVIKYGGGAELVFNYRSEFNAIWDNAALRDEYGYTTRFPAVDAEGIAIEF